MTSVGNHDASYGTVPAAAGPTPATSAPRAFGAPDTRRVVLRVQGDENIVVGNAEGRENAVRIAREFVQHIELASTRGEWPQVDERFIRPGAIVSVDVQRAE